MKEKNIAVLGGGVSGLTAAYTLVRKGFNVTVIEKNDYLGGLASTFSYKNHLIDYGPHNFHTHSQKVLSFVRDELAIPLKRMPITSSRLFFMGKFVTYPLKITDAVKNLSLGISIRCFFDYLLSRIRLKFGTKEDAKSFEGWVKSRFGGYIYDLYFGPYVKKVWGIPGYELDAVVARRRIPEPSLFSLIIRSLMGIRHGKKHSEDPEAVESYYPPNGIGMISDKLRGLIVKNGGTILLNCKINSIDGNSDPKEKKRIHYAINGSDGMLESDYVISTIPINSLFSVLRIPGAVDMQKDVAALPYRSIILLYMFLSVEKVFDAPWIYFNEKDNPELIFNRMYEIGNFSRKMIHDNNGVMCLEITCYKGDELWEKSDGELFEKAMAYLEKNNLMKRDIVKEVITKRLEVAYPVFNKGYHSNLVNIVRFLTGRGDIFCIGRQGLFSYANTDHCIDMGLKSGELFGPDTRPQSYYHIYRDYLF